MGGCVADQRERGLQAMLQVGRAQSSACLLGQLGGFLKIKGVWPHHHRAAAGGGFDQVLAAQRCEAATQQSHVAHGVVQRHFAE